MTPRAPAVFARVLLLGLAWYAFELALVALEGSGATRGEILHAWLSTLPWQIALSAGLAVAVTLVARAFSLGRAAVAWWSIGAICFVFLGVRVAEGALRTTSPATAAAYLCCVAAAIAAVLGGLAAAGRWLPAPARAAWPAAVSVAISVAAIPFLRRAGASIALGELPLAAWPGFVAPGSLLAGLAAGAVTLGLASRRARALALWIGLAGGMGAGAAQAAPPDVILVLLDTMRDDHVGARLGEESLTPHLDAIAAEGVRFRRAYSPANITRRAMPALLAASTERIVGAPLAPGVRTIATELSAAGLATVGISANPFVSRHYGYARGFDRFSDPGDAPTFLVAPLVQLLLNLDGGLAYRFGLIGSALYYEPADRLFARGVRVLDEVPRPSLLYLHMMDVHGPYLPPRRLLPADYDPSRYVPYSRMLRLDRAQVLDPAFAPVLENVRQRYAAGVRFADEQIGRLRSDLEARGRWDEALVCLVADHGEALGEQGFVGHGVASLMPVLTQVPFIWKLPRSWGIPPHERHEAVSTSDLVPTLLALLDRPALPDAFGASLAEALRGAAEPVVRDVISWNIDKRIDHYSVIRDHFQLALQIGADGRRTRQLFDLAADPGATRDVAAEHPERVAALEESVDGYRTRELRLVRDHGDAVLDSEMRARLRALGYVDAP